jgi:E3 ubiquitin-protein ligase TRIP12
MGEAHNRHEAEDPDHDEDMADRSPDEEEGEDDEERYGEEDYDRDEDDEDDDDDDVFDGSYLGGSGAISHTLRALSGLVSGISSRLRDILENLRQKDDPTTQLIALQNLAELLLVSTEDNLSGHFSPDQFVKELVSLMQDQGPFGDNPEMALLACRCIANLMEALPAATANVVYGGAVPVLCAKLMEISYIDLAEQALSVSCVARAHVQLLTITRLSKRSRWSILPRLFVRAD